MKLIDVSQQSDEWHVWRSTIIGASESAAVLGKCKYKTPYQLWLEKTNRAPGFTGNIATERGNEIEDKARVSYEMLHGDFETFEPVCVQHPDIDYIGASLDGWSGNLKRIVEIKYVSEASHQLAAEGQVPEHYLIQCRHQLLCVPEALELHYWSYREGDGKLVSALRDLEFEEHLRQKLAWFQSLIVTDTPPPLTTKDAKQVNDPGIVSLCESLKKEKNKDEQKVLKAKIIDLGGHPKIKCGDVQITTVMRKGVFSFHKLTISQTA